VRSVAIAIAVAASCWAGTAFAEPSADELKTRGNQAMLELNYQEAITAYKAALALNPNDVSLHYNLGRAHQARGDYPAALDALTEFEQKAPPETKAKVPSLAQLVADVKSRVGELTVHCNTEVSKGAIVVEGGSKVEGCSTSPKRIRVSVAAKSASVELRLESDVFQAPPVKVDVVGGGPPVDVAFAVTTKSNVGLLRVVATPASAIVSVDGSAKGNSPVELSLPAGSHVVDVAAESYESAHVPFVLEVGGKKELNLTLEKSAPLTKRWWFWAGTGVVAAAAISAAVILIVQPEREASRGTIDPGVIRAPLATF
jgi:hypothetical protein